LTRFAAGISINFGFVEDRNMRIAIGSDHAGYPLKEALKPLLEQHEVVDLGTFGTAPVDYPDYAKAVGAAVRDARVERGVLVCGSGVGASIAANKLSGVRAALCHDTYSAHQGVEHDDMNVLVLGGRVVGVELARELVEAFLGARFNGEERHLRRLAKTVTLENPLRALGVLGQSLWLDFIRRSLMTSGELGRLIERDGLKGVTSNPAIFEKAVSAGSDYDDLLAAPDAAGLDAKGLYERLAIRDVQAAADALSGVYDRTRQRDGYVSLEVSPFLAYDTAGTLSGARRLWRAVGRHNLMIKVPATAEGIHAVRTLIGEGINVNDTLLFSQEIYARVAEAYLDGLDTLIARGGNPRGVASVASFFVSRIDTAADARIANLATRCKDSAEQRRLQALMGRVAIANAKLAYRHYQALVGGERWQALAAAGARPQRLLWASTGTKDPRYRDVVYVEELIGPDTVNTMPPATLEAFRDHGRPRQSLTESVESAEETLSDLAAAGISLTEITDSLLSDGVRLFAEAFEKLLGAVGSQRHADRATA
jgi:transaldolase/glucose-6-phosphate isomerase